MEEIKRINFLSFSILLLLLTGSLFLFSISVKNLNFKIIISAISDINSSVCTLRCLRTSALTPLIVNFIKTIYILLFLSSIAFSFFKTFRVILNTNSFISEICKNSTTEEKFGVFVKIFENYLPLAFTAGFLKPKIYISSHLVKSMSKEELKGIIFHESKHMKDKDPLKSLFVSFISNLLFFIPFAKSLRKTYETTNEIIADMNSVERGVTPETLAKSFLKTLKLKSFENSWFFSKSYERINFLLEGKFNFSPLRNILLPLGIIIVNFSLFFPLANKNYYDIFFSHKNSCNICIEREETKNEKFYKILSFNSDLSSNCTGRNNPERALETRN